MEIRPIDPAADAALIDGLARRVAGRPGLTVLSEGKSLALSTGVAGGVVGLVDGQVAGVAVTAPALPGERAVELVEDGRLGEDGVTGLLAAVVETANADGVARLRLWAYAGATVDGAVRVGFRPERTLLRMARSLPAGAPQFPPNVDVAAFRPGTDEAAVLAVNNAAFAGHPENGAWTVEDIELRTRSPWFSAEGFRLAWDGGDELAGFCWTKVHSDGNGEIYVIATAPRYQGRGLGKHLVLEGMRHLSSVGAPTVFLYTEGDNDRAVRLYERLGFGVESTSRAWLLVL